MRRYAWWLLPVAVMLADRAALQHTDPGLLQPRQVESHLRDVLMGAPLLLIAIPTGVALARARHWIIGVTLAVATALIVHLLRDLITTEDCQHTSTDPCALRRGTNWGTFAGIAASLALGIVVQAVVQFGMQRRDRPANPVASGVPSESGTIG
ncbi:hypothetical protein [Humibacter sp.]|uniref:hypothetical protein n=1 Tax=Humibacter sp. TaxID=1940291 RepID=UPI002CDBC6BD|nr:hypothetical protein [Humibacter sp.]HVX07609.1 hypothetical protein [Humibacter sp.]